ncbi:MAG: septal ring lytic transglycosylase RlpA family protein [Alphaproteobacteria bacterium]|nr:septal ring lytic transglycosylase RlpA family protein [Alphaproteobacteria bacterium]
MIRRLCLVPLISLLVSGCSYQTRTGGTNVSSKPYFCRGRWHYPQNYYEYDETGLASWYGADFHGKKKATGELFDRFGMTAAHRTLPLPTVVKVTSLMTNKSVVLVVDDRGPYIYKGRIIDLSYGAASALGIARFGPSKVHVQSLPRESLKLSNYIRKNCKKRKDPYGRSWSELYFQEIARTQPRTIRK